MPIHTTEKTNKGTAVGDPIIIPPSKRKDPKKKELPEVENPNEPAPYKAPPSNIPKPIGDSEGQKPNKPLVRVMS